MEGNVVARKYVGVEPFVSKACSVCSPGAVMINRPRHEPVQNPVQTPTRRLWDISLEAMGGALGLLPERAGTVEELTKERGVAARHQWLLRRWMLALEREKIVELQGDRYRVINEIPSPDGELDAVCAELGFSVDMTLLLRDTLAHLPALLRDEVSVHNLLPEGVAEVFPDHVNVHAEQLNDACAALVGNAVRQRAEPVRVLEVGGGAGHTTASVLNELAGFEFSYLFTDVSGAMLATAGRFGVTAEVLDIDRDPREQGFAAGSFDIVLACDVLHHASDVIRTLSWLRGLLSSGGQLLLVVRKGDDLVSLVSSHFSFSPPAGGAVRRDGEVYPPAEFWRDALSTGGFSTGMLMSAGERACPDSGYRLFQAWTSV